MDSKGLTADATEHTSKITDLRYTAASLKSHKLQSSRMWDTVLYKRHSPTFRGT